jgi:hypothetical protein
MILLYIRKKKERKENKTVGLQQVLATPVHGTQYNVRVALGV